MSFRGIRPLLGEIWWVRLDPTIGSEIAKTRPCVVITTDIVNERRRTVVIIPISSGPAPAPPLNIAVNCEGITGVAVIDQIRAAAKERFGSRVGRLSQPQFKAVEDGLRRALGLVQARPERKAYPRG